MHRTPLESGMDSSRPVVLPPPVQVLFYPSPLRQGDRHRFEFSDDLTVAEIVDRLTGLRPVHWDLRVTIEGAKIPESMWRHTRPNPGVLVTVVGVPQNAQQGKGIAQIIIGLSLLVAGIFLAGATWLPATLLGVGPLGFGLAGAAFLVSGAYSVASPPPSVPFSGEIPASESRAISAPRNEPRPMSAVPRVFGRYRMYPPYAAKPFTEVVGNDQFMRLLFTFGYGPLELSDLKIGEDPIENFEGVEWNFLPGYDDDPDLAIFTSSVDEEVFQITLEPLGTPPVVRTTELDTYEASIDILFPAGLIAFEADDGRPRSATANFVVRYRPAGSVDPGDWVGVTLPAPLAPGVTNPSPGVVAISARARGSLIRGLRWIFPSAGQWEVEIEREADEFDTDSLGTLIADAQWAKLRSIRPGTPPRVPNLSMLEMRIQASEQLSGVVQNLSAVVESILPIWNSIDGWGPDNRLTSNLSLETTRNPAWALAEMLRGVSNPRPVPDENVDAVSIAEWAISNAAAGRNFDAIVDFETTVAQVCRDIAGSARASFNVIDGRYGVVVDEPKPLVVAHFSTRDTSNFSATRVFSRPVHGLRARFVSPEAGYSPEEMIVYADGYDETNATEFGDLDLWGVTDPDRAYRDGRYHLAAGKLRPEVYSFDLDVSHLAITRGDRVLFSHDVISVGLGSGRVREVLTDSGTGATVAVRIDQVVEYDPALAYAVRIRHGATGNSTQHPIFNLAADTDWIAFSPPLEAPTELPVVGDMLAWGESGREVGDYIVFSITPNSDLGARVDLVDYSPAIFTADTEAIPPFDPNITVPSPRELEVPETPVIDQVSSDESVLIVEEDGARRVRILISVSVIQGDTVQASSLQAQFRTTSPLGGWFSAPQVSASTPQITIENVDQGERYDIRVRAISADGRASSWAFVGGHLVIGTSTPPPDVQSLRIQAQTLLIWDYPVRPRDFVGFLIRHQAGSDTLWSTAIPAHDGVVTESLFDISSLPTGPRTILVRAIDSSGNLSTNAGVVVKDIAGTRIENVVETQDFHALGFPGTITDATIEPATDDLVADSEVTQFWPVNDGLFWGAAGDLFWGSSFKAVTYLASWTPPGAAVPGRMFLQYTIQGSSWTIDYRVQGTTEWLRWPGFIDAEASTTYEFRLQIDGGATRGRVEAFAAIIDKPDVEEVIEDAVIASSGTVRLPIANTYTVIKQVLVTVQDDGNGGVSARVVDKNASLGPSVVVFDASGTRVAGLVDAQIKGYN